MDKNNVHTSVVIEVGSEEEVEDQNVYKIDLDDIETPKDYVIDQIFSGENVTVYALFEVSDVREKKSENLIGVTDNAASKDCRFYHRNSYKTAINGRHNRTKHKLSRINPNSDPGIGTEQNNEIKYSQQYEENSEKLPRKNSLDLKELYNKDKNSKYSKSKKLRAASKGVNTVIAQCPKLLENVRKSMNLDVSNYETEKNFHTISSSWKPTFELIDMELQRSSSSTISDSNSKPYSSDSSPNLLVVPILIKEDCIMNHLKKEDSQKLMEEKVVRKNLPPNKISTGVNTEIAALAESEIKGITNSPKKLKATECQTVDLEEYELQMQENTNEVNTKKNSTVKDTILEEIRDLKWKLNVLIKSLECNGISCNDLKEKEFAEDEIETPEELKDITKESETRFFDAESVSKTSKKFDEWPIFSPECCSPILNKCSKNKQDCKSKEDNSLVTIKSEISVESVSRSISSITQEISNLEKPEIISDELNINWEDIRTMGLSKSESKCTSSPKPHLRKSLSFDRLDEKLDVPTIKKMKNFKLDFISQSKNDIKVLKNKKATNLTVLTCEMGDDVLTKVSSILSLLKLDKSEKVYQEVETNKEEGDTKTFVTAELIKNLDKLEVITCNSSDDKKEKNEKSRNLDKSLERLSSATGKPSQNKNVKKINSPTGKKDVKTAKKNNVDVKINKKDNEPGSPKQKPMNSSRKITSRNTAECKQVDKVPKKEEIDKSKASSKYVKQVSGTADASPKLSRPSSLKATSRQVSKEKQDTSLKPCNVLAGRNSPLTRNIDENINHCLVFDRVQGDNVNSTSSDASKIIVELFSRKPKKFDNICPEVTQEGLYDNKNIRKNKDEKEIEKSVWALTKVLMYEDSSKKFEVLESSI